MHTESLWFRIVCFIIIVFILGYILASAIYFNDLKNGATISNTNASTMLVVAIIAFVALTILWIWVTVRLFFSKKERDVYVAKKTSAESNYFGRSDVSLPVTSQAQQPQGFVPIAPNPTYQQVQMMPQYSTTESGIPISTSVLDFAE